MSDPHVVSLRYRVVPGNGVDFEHPPAVESIQPGFRVRLADGIARVEMVEHHADIEAARAAAEPYLRAWELQDALQRTGRKEFVFQYVDAEVIDRDPPPPGSVTLLTGAARGTSTARAELSVTYRAYPSPPRDFVASPDVDVMWLRYHGYQRGREPIAAMAYFCLTVLETDAGSRKGACTKYGIDPPLRDLFGDLISEKGGEAARKMNRHSGRPYTQAERRWIDLVVRALIRRAGEYAANPSGSFPLIDFNQYPPP